MERYQSIMAAIRILEQGRLDVCAVEGVGPTWNMLYNAAAHLRKQAEAEFSKEFRAEVA